MKRLVVLFAFAVVAVMVLVGFATAETKKGKDTPSMEQVLFNPKGFDMAWTCGGNSGHSRVFFIRQGENIVTEIRVVDIENVDINNPTNFGKESCDSYAKLTEKGITFFGCRSASWDIPLVYDPGNKETPFKGSGADCPSIALNPR